MTQHQEANSAENADIAAQYVGAPCTIDGRPATIMGRQLRFAIVAQLPDGLQREYAWPTVARIMGRGGDFRS